MSESAAEPALSTATIVPDLAVLGDRAQAAGYMDVVDWVRCECNGYRASVPTYRRIDGLPMGFNPMKGWIPLYSENAVLLRAVGNHGLRQSVSVIEAAIASSANGRALIHQSGEAINIINAAAGTNYAQVATSVDVRKLHSLLAAVASLTGRWLMQIAAPTTPQVTAAAIPLDNRQAPNV